MYYSHDSDALMILLAFCGNFFHYTQCRNLFYITQQLERIFPFSEDKADQ
jgi:hypothetical protein